MKFDNKTQKILPAYFAMVMATGILSLAFYFTGFDFLGYSLFYVNVGVLLLLTVLFGYCCLFLWDAVVIDFKDYSKGPTFFAIVAAISIVGSQFVSLYGNYSVGLLLLTVAILLWVLISYGFFFNMAVSKNKKSLQEGISGTWLMFIVSTQSISILISFLSVNFGEYKIIYLFFALGMFLLGCLFYFYIMSLIVYRMLFFTIEAKALEAPYWINMGAASITTMAGAMLVQQANEVVLISELSAFLKGFILLFWSAGTWWIPLLVIFGIWRHLINKVPFPISPKGYHPSYWGMVFPLGMYTVCTKHLSDVLLLPFLEIIAHIFIPIAFFAWIVVTIGFITHLVKNIPSRV